MSMRLALDGTIDLVESTKPLLTTETNTADSVRFICSISIGISLGFGIVGFTTS
ncbi:MAG: hypothetical protein IPF70_16265 [Saprospiraceae bacterium]|nr:hypothetical protein [Saprospiraceae bacterium]